MTDADSGEWKLRKKVEPAALEYAAQVVAGLRDGEVEESTLRLCRAFGDDKRVHLRTTDLFAGLCGRVAARYETELAEVSACRSLKTCPGCMKRADPAQRAFAVRRAMQVAVRGMKRKVP